MSTTILETPIRVFKLTDGNKKITNKSSLGIHKLNPLHELLETSETIRKELVPFTHKMTIHDTIDRIVRTLREPIAELQEKRGVSKNQQYSFIELVMSLFQQSYNACLAIITMLFGILPLMEGLLTLCRFVLDKIIEINDTSSPGEKAFKCLVFSIELFAIFMIVMIIISIILLPVLHLLEYNFHKVWNMAAH